VSIPHELDNVAFTKPTNAAAAAIATKPMPTVPTVEQGKKALTQLTQSLPPADELIVLCLVLCVLWAAVPPILRFLWSSVATAAKAVTGLVALGLVLGFLVKWWSSTGAAPF